ncbi:MAG: hypothetical protein KF878_14635, partial [Planctomycetes bacterium]|nr:hypothetical protein [Planctomycetota bacterium]
MTRARRTSRLAGALLALLAAPAGASDALLGEFVVTLGSPAPGDPDALVLHVTFAGAAGDELQVQARWGATPLLARGRRLGPGTFELALAARGVPALVVKDPEDAGDVDPAAARPIDVHWTLRGRRVLSGEVDDVRARLEGLAEMVEVQGELMRTSSARFRGVPAWEVEEALVEGGEATP